MIQNNELIHVEESVDEYIELQEDDKKKLEESNNTDGN